MRLPSGNKIHILVGHRRGWPYPNQLAEVLEESDMAPSNNHSDMPFIDSVIYWRPEKELHTGLLSSNIEFPMCDHTPLKQQVTIRPVCR